MPPKVWDKPASQRKDRPQNSQNNARRPEKNQLKAWEAPTVYAEDETDIVSWMKSQDLKDKKLSDDDDELLLMRQYGLGKCPSIENTGQFERESLHDRFIQNCQFTGGDNTGENAEKASPEPKTETQPKTVERPKSESCTKAAESPIQKQEQRVLINVAKRVCKSAIPFHHSPGAISEEKEIITPDDDVSLPVRNCTSADHSQGSSCNVAELPESKTKVRKLIGLAQKYMTKTDIVRDEGEDCNDEGYDSKISSNDAEVVEDLKNIEEVLLARERYLAETYDVDQNPHHMNTFQWIRDPAGLTPGRIVKLSYSQREKTFYSLNNERCDSLGRTISRPNTNSNFRGIMAASLSNLSPSSLNMRQFRDSGGLHFLNYGAPGTPRWGYENNSRGQFLPSQVESGLGESKPTTMVLRKVTIQDAHAENSISGEKTPSPENVSAETPESKRKEPILAREKSKLQLTRTSPQLTIDSTKISRNGSIPSQQQTRNMSRVAGRRDELKSSKSQDPRDYIYNDSSSSSRIPIGDLLPAVERSILKTQYQKSRRGQGEGSYPGAIENDPNGVQAYPSLSEEERAILIKRDMEALAASYEPRHGPPAFLPLHTRSPLQRAKEIANKRLHGHVTQNPDGSETVRVSSPRFQPRGFQRRAGSATGFLGRVISGPFRGKCKTIEDRS